MKYNILGTRYEGTTIFGTIILCSTPSELWAKTIVDALNKSDNSVLFYFTYEKDE